MLPIIYPNLIISYYLLKIKQIQQPMFLNDLQHKKEQQLIHVRMRPGNFAAAKKASNQALPTKSQQEI